MLILQMDAFMFGDEEMSGLISKASFNVTAMVVVVSRFGGEISHYGKTNRVTLNGTPNSQPRGS
jgi:hypothetical protein